MKKRRFTALGIAFCMSASFLLAGCSTGKTSDTTTANQTTESNLANGATENTKNTETATTESKTEESKTTEGKTTNLKIYKKLHTNLQQYAGGNEELPMFKELEKRTNTKLTFMTPPVGQEKEQFNLIIASGEYPDIFIDMWTDYTGGGAKALSDQVILPLNDLIEEHAPNIKTAMAEYPEAFRYVTNENGDMYGVPMVYTNKMQQVTWGINIRKDWLDDLGLDMPETVDEYYEALKGFRDEKGATAPFTITFAHLKNSRFLAGAYGVSTDFYQENGTIKYGPIQSGYKEYLKTLNKWYEEGLLDRDFITIDANTRSAKMLNNQAGMSWAPSKGGVAAWNQGLQTNNPDAMVVGGAYASLEKGQPVKSGQVNPPGSMSAAISSTCKDPVSAIQFLDYMFSEEGRILMNFGIEGESYTMVDGEPVITDLVLKAEDMPVLSKMNFYATSAEGNAGVATIVDQRYLEQVNAVTPHVTEALQTWANSNTFEAEIPGIIPASKDSSRYSSIMNEVTTYTDEMFLKFVTGQESIDDKFDSYVNEVEKKGIQEATQIMQSAYDTFMQK